MAKNETFDYEEQKRQEAAMTAKQEALYAAINKKYAEDPEMKHAEHENIRDEIREILKRRYYINDNQCAITAINSEYRDWQTGQIRLSRAAKANIQSYKHENMDHAISMMNNMKNLDKICDTYQVTPIFGDATTSYKEALNKSVYMQNIITREADAYVKEAFAEKEIEDKRKSRPLPSYEGDNIENAMKNMGAELD